MEDITLDEGLRLLEKGISSFGAGVLHQAAIPAVTALLAVLLCGTVETMFPSKERAAQVLPFAGTVAIAGAVSGDLFALVGSCRSTVGSLDTFSKGLLATLAATGTATGAPGGASARYIAAMLFSDALIGVMDSVLIPALMAYVAVCIAATAIGGDALGGLAKFLRNTVVTILSLMLTAFTLYLTVSGIVAGGADALTVKATKTVISNAVPVVGSAIADASDTVIASARILRSSTGVAGIISLSAIALLPFMRLGARYLLLKIAGSVSPLICGGRIAKLIEDLAGAFGILLGMVAASALMALVATVSMITLSSA